MATGSTRILLTNSNGVGRYINISLSSENIISIVDEITGVTALVDVTLDEIKSSQTVTVEDTDFVWGGVIATHKVPITLNGQTYSILLVAE